VAAVVGDALRLALDEVAAARDVNQRARNQHYDESPDCGRSAQPHAVQNRSGARPNWGGHRPPSQHEPPPPATAQLALDNFLAALAEYQSAQRAEGAT
jgi:hypothetical protein